jgi:hypothetical protein
LRNTVFVAIDLPTHETALWRDEGAKIARACVHAAGLADRVEVSHDARDNALLISGPDQFGMMGTTLYATVRVALPASVRSIAIATARHVLGEFHATDQEIAARASELPLALAMVLAGGRR